MSDNGDMVIGRIVIERRLSEDGDQVWCEALDGSGEPLALVESLGMLRMTEDTLIRAAMGEIPEADE